MAYSDAEVNRAMNDICAALPKLRAAIQVTAQVPGADSQQEFSTRLKRRQALVISSDYLHFLLRSNPALPTDIRDLVEELAGAERKIAMKELAGEDADAVRDVADNAGETLETRCPE